MVNRSAKSLKRRIEEAETQKALLDDLAKSERALLLFGFKSLFALLGLVSLIFALQTFFVSILRGRLDPLDLILVLLWFIPAIISIYLADVVKKLGEYPGSAETIDKKIATLKRKLRGGRV